MIILTSLFFSLPYLCLLSLYPGLILRQGHCFNWMYKTLSYIGILRRKFIWSNPQAMVLRREQKSIISRRPYMDSSRVQERDLRSSALPFLLLDFNSVVQITLSSFAHKVWHRSSDCLCWYFVDW